MSVAIESAVVFFSCGMGRFGLASGDAQRAAIRWLPADFFGSSELEACGVLYYTGVTRVAHDEPLAVK